MEKSTVFKKVYTQAQCTTGSLTVTHNVYYYNAAPPFSVICLQSSCAFSPQGSTTPSVTPTAGRTGGTRMQCKLFPCPLTSFMCVYIHVLMLGYFSHVNDVETLTLPCFVLICIGDFNSAN